jgi:predicted RNase H-like HicB family nuclease
VNFWKVLIMREIQVADLRDSRFGGFTHPESRMMKPMGELVFEAIQEADGGYSAECLTENIFTQGDTWEELRKNVVDATAAFFFDQKRPERIRLHLVHLVRDEVLLV